MDKRINVLVFPCGSENALEIHQSLKDVVNITLYGASGKDDHGSYVFENYIGNVPYIHSEDFIPSINKIVEIYDIHVILPTHDDVVLKLAENAKVVNTKIAIPGLNQAIICRSKRKTYDLFKKYGFCPKVYTEVSESVEFPIFAKPDEGQGGQGAFLISTKKEWTEKFKSEYIYSEYLPGEELTVDCFSDRNGTLQFIGPRIRQRVFSGISVRSITTKLTNEIEDIANRIHFDLKMDGLWYFQIKKNVNGEFKLLEVSIRVAGTMNLYRGLGVNFSLLTIYNSLGYDLSILKNDYALEVDRAFYNRYKHNIFYDTIYIDFDDTITRNGKVNPEVILFIYKAKNDGKNIILITKHELILEDTLNELKIHKELFDKIIQIKKSELKSQYIDKNQKSIFIDNSFSERKDVKNALNIPVFDVDAINTLINWKN
jgi:predicted ATP-grasp superfamily ATP-dependent carboligase